MEVFDLLAKLPISDIIQNEQCKYHTLMTMKSIFTGAPWALQMLDSTTKLQSGLMEGNFNALGNYDECVGVEVKEEWGSFKGQHCMATVRLQDKILFLPIRWSVCVPSSCTYSDISKFFSTVFNYTIEMNPGSCHTRTSRPFTFQDWLGIIILSIFALIIIFSTVYDYTVTDPERRRPVLLAFSWYTNAKQLFSIKNSSGDTIRCLQGMRYISAVMIIVAHTYLMTTFVPAINMLHYRELMTQWSHIFVTGSIFVVESFLVFSGFLLCYLFLKAMEKGVKFNLALFYLFRYIRLTPLFAIALLFHAGLVLHLADGPLWETGLNWFPEVCKRSWWSSLLYLHNYVHTNEMCMTVAWYLAVDMQLYILSPLLLFPLLRWPRKTLVFILLLIIASTVSNFLDLYTNGITSGFIEAGVNIPNSYFYTHTRASPWLMGIILGYIMYKTRTWRDEVAKGVRNGLSKKNVVVGWLIGEVCIFIPLIWSHRFAQYEFVPTPFENALYASSGRFTWSIGICWMIFACTSGYGGFLNTFLSWNIFEPLSRLSYAIYLIHYPYMHMITFSLRASVYIDDFNLIYSIFSTTVSVTFLAIPAYLTFEAPAGILLKTFLEGEKKTKESPGKIK